jgi:hypothetical protein
MCVCACVCVCVRARACFFLTIRREVKKNTGTLLQLYHITAVKMVLHEWEYTAGMKVLRSVAGCTLHVHKTNEIKEVNV